MYFVVLVVVSVVVNVRASTIPTALPDVITDETITNQVTDTMARKIIMVKQTGTTTDTMETNDRDVLTTAMVSQATAIDIDETTPSITLMTTASTIGAALPDQTTQTPPDVTTMCTAGFVQCRNGGCEPFASLCGDEGIVTVATEVPVTIDTVPATYPMSTGEHTTVAGTSTEMITQTTNTMDLFAGMTDITTTTVSVTNMVTDGECHLGFVKCVDGRCEPYEHLCGDAGIVTIATEVPVSINTVPATHPMSTGEHTTVAGTSKEMITQTTNTMDMFTGMTDNTMTTVSVTNMVKDGECHLGFVKCVDGRCEPYEHLCGDAGFITLPTVSTIPTTASPSVVTDIAGASTASGVSTTTGTPASTLPTTIATLPPLDNGCPPGLEKCSDETCEPFHFMCDEHLSSQLIGR